MSVLRRKILPSIFGIATIGWIIGGTIWFDNQLTQSNSIASSKALTFSRSTAVSKGGTLPNSLCFKLGSSAPVFLNEQLTGLQQTANFLTNNTHQSVLIKGVSDSREKPIDKNINLGFARAEAVKTILTNFGAPNNSLDITTEQRNNLTSNNGQVCDAVELKFVEHTNTRFQALNLFFKKDKFRFVENSELQIYFNDLTNFLQKNPTAKLKIAAYRSNTEGGKTSTNRLAFIADFLKNKRMDSRQFIFEDNKKTTLVTAAVADAENLKNQRLEIRIMTP